MPEQKCVTCPVVLELADDKKWQTQCYDCFRDKNTMRNCEVCDEPKIPVTEEKWKRVCGKCYENSPLKPCIGCRQVTVKAVEKFRSLCKDCWTHKEDYLRICETEGCDRVINEKSKVWVKTCMDCYKVAKSVLFETCPTCPPDRSHWLVKRKTAPACRACMLVNGDIITMGSLVSSN